MVTTAGIETGQPDSSLALLQHYRSLYRCYGASHRAVQWSSADAQQRRFAVLAESVGRDEHVLDVGCGLGDLLGHLRNVGRFAGCYTGIDQVPEFIADAKLRFANDLQASFEVVDVRELARLPDCDCALVSGLFNNRMTPDSDNAAWLKETVSHLFSIANRVVAFNALSTWVERREQTLFYVDPDRLVGWCASQLTRNLVLRHDYNASPALGVPVDFTIYLYK